MRTFVFLVLAMLALAPSTAQAGLLDCASGGKIVFHIKPARAGLLDWASGDKVVFHLKRGDFTVLRYAPKSQAPGAGPRALILFGSGCGGWSYWEENVCHRLQADGYEVLGIDFSLYAQTDYNLATLEQDYRTIVKQDLAPNGQRPPPVVIGGWSTGAEQAVAVASGPCPPPGLAGLLLVSPGSEGGYGPYATNYLYLDAPASKTFMLDALAPKMSKVRVAQWHAEFDPLDSRAWLQTLKAPHREYDFPDAIHDYHGACPAFLTGLSASVSWLLAPKSTPLDPSKNLVTRAR